MHLSPFGEVYEKDAPSANSSPLYLSGIKTVNGYMHAHMKAYPCVVWFIFKSILRLFEANFEALKLVPAK